jgi:endonuclease-3 related protein
MGLIQERDSYDRIREFFERSQKRDYPSFQEFHALIVEHAKESCAKNPKCRFCAVRKLCEYAVPP